MCLLIVSFGVISAMTDLISVEVVGAAALTQETEIFISAEWHIHIYIQIKMQMLNIFYLLKLFHWVRSKEQSGRSASLHPVRFVSLPLIFCSEITFSHLVLLTAVINAAAAAVLSHQCLHTAEQINCQKCTLCTPFIESRRQIGC